MEVLKNEIFDDVSRLRDQKMGKQKIKERLEKTLSKDIPIGLIDLIFAELTGNKKKIEKMLSTADTFQSKNEEKEDGGLKKLAASEKPNLKYDVSERHYIFYTKDGGSYPVLISVVRSIFECYSRYGKDMSGEEIRQQFKFGQGVFELIKNATGLMKASPVDDPITLSRIDGIGLEDYIEGRVEKTIEDKYMANYYRATNQKKNRDLAKFAKSKNGYTIFLEQFEEIMKSYEPKEFGKIEAPKNSDVKNVFITDAHIGKKGTEGIIERFSKLTDDMINSPEGVINITFGGDLAECFLPYGEMHVGQRLGMEDIKTPDLVMLVVDVFEKMLSKIYESGKVVTFNGMLGNHDRFTDKKEFDPYRTPAVIVYKFLQRILQDTSIKINILEERANVIKSGKIKYLFIHGDGLSLREIKDRALAEKESDSYLVIVSGDKHHFAMLEISDKVLWIQSPALAGAGQYDKSLGLSSIPGAIFFSENSDEMVDVTIRRYKD